VVMAMRGLGHTGKTVSRGKAATVLGWRGVGSPVASARELARVVVSPLAELPEGPASFDRHLQRPLRFFAFARSTFRSGGGQRA